MGNESSGGIGFAGLMFLLFLGLKLGGVIDWSWWWVFAPLWIPALTVILILLVVIMIAMISTQTYGHQIDDYGLFERKKWWQIWKR